MFHFGGESNKFTCCMRRPPVFRPPLVSLHHPVAPTVHCATRPAIFCCPCLPRRNANARNAAAFAVGAARRARRATCRAGLWIELVWGKVKFQGHKGNAWQIFHMVRLDAVLGRRLCHWRLLCAPDFLGSHLNYCCRFAKMICFEFK